MRLRPIPPAAYAAATAVVYAAVGVGVVEDLMVYPLTVPAGVTLASCVYALMSLARGRAGEEATSICVLVCALCIDFVQAPPPGGVWVTWTYSIFIGIVAVLLIRCWWLCKRL